MSLLERKIIHPGTTSCSHILYPRFVLPRHKHPEVEIMIFTEGSGKQFVGEGVSDFKEGDIAIIGSNVPHLHLCSSQLEGTDRIEPASGEVLQFLPSIFPIGLQNFPDYKEIYDLQVKSRHGIRLYDRELFEQLKVMFGEIDSLEYTARLIHLLQIIEKLSLCKNWKLLSDTAYNAANIAEDSHDPTSRVYTYLYNNFREKIALNDVASFVSLNPSALCRSFRQKTDKSIFRVLAEIRIEHACRLLSYSKTTISQAAYESGYNSLPHFIKQFHEIMGRTPTQYRQQINNR